METYFFNGTKSDEFLDEDKWGSSVGKYIDNPEYFQATIDSSNKVINGIKPNGINEFNVGIETKKINISGNEYYVVENPEWIRAIIDSDNKILCGIRQNGKFYADIDGIDEQVKGLIQPLLDEVDELVERFDEIFKLVDNHEYMSVELDSDDKILGGRKTDGTKFENVGLDLGGGLIKGMDDPECRMEIRTDYDHKIINYRKEDGTLVENVGIETPFVKAKQLVLEEEGLSDLGRELKRVGFAGVLDWSDKEFVDLPIPRTCAIVNVGVDDQVLSKTADVETFLEYWDMDGNYFKKPILFNAQGASSMFLYHLKNQAFDLNDGSEIRFGKWIANDSFHLKKYFVDVFRGQAIVAYRLAEQAYQNRPFGERRPWSYLIKNDSISNGLGKFANDWDSGALSHPDGFPVKLFFNGKNAGIYALAMKKARGNYFVKKDDAKQIILDGVMEAFFICNNNMHRRNDGTPDENYNQWTQFELRNPKGIVYAEPHNGTYKYDADNPGQYEIAGNADGSLVYDNYVAGTSYPVNKIVTWTDEKGKKHQFINTEEGNTKAPVITSTNTDKDPDFKGKTKCGWINCTFTCKAKNVTMRLTTAMSLVDEESTTEAKRTKYEEFFNIPFMVDYALLANILYHYDGIDNNVIWITNDGSLWSPTIYDTDTIFGQYGQGNHYQSESINRILGPSHERVPFKQLFELYKDELDARYRELRVAEIFDADNITAILEDWVMTIGYDNLKEDIEEICTSPYYDENDELARDSSGNLLLLPNTPTYRDGSIKYVYGPQLGGWYNTVGRVHNWLESRLEVLDNYFNYN